MFEFRSAEEASSIVMFGVLFGITAGIMTEVAIKSLLLEAARYDPEDRVVSKVCQKFRKIAGHEIIMNRHNLFVFRPGYLVHL